jgi:hypothetical protein
MAQDDRCRVVLQRLNNDLSGIDRSLGQSAPEHLFNANDSVLSIQQEQDEDFMGPVPQLQTQKVFDCSRRMECIACAYFTCQQSKRLLDDGVSLVHVHGFDPTLNTYTAGKVDTPPLGVGDGPTHGRPVGVLAYASYRKTLKMIGVYVYAHTFRNPYEPPE